jgi:hypothetical protein
VEMHSGQGSITLPSHTYLVIDPERWILMDTPVITSLDDFRVSSTPLEFQLYQNYPNPFNPSTIINYELPITNYIDLSVYNVLGEKVATLVSGIQKGGFHRVQWDANDMAAGVYIYKFRAGKFSDVKKMIVIR